MLCGSIAEPSQHPCVLSLDRSARAFLVEDPEPILAEVIHLQGIAQSRIILKDELNAFVLPRGCVVRPAKLKSRAIRRCALRNCVTDWRCLWRSSRGCGVMDGNCTRMTASARARAAAGQVLRLRLRKEVLRACGTATAGQKRIQVPVQKLRHVQQS